MVRLILLLLLAWAAPAAAQQFPALSGRVVDAANILPADVRAAIEERSAAIEAATGAQLVVATIPDLGGYPIEEYGYRLGRAWGIGRKRVQGEGDDGVILIVAPNARRVRIEVGYGLEPVLTDTLTSVIIQRRILPRFRDGDLPGGVKAGVDAIAEQLELPPDEARARAAAARPDSDGLPIGLFIFLGFFLLWLWLATRRGAIGRVAAGHHGSGPIVVWGPGAGGSKGSSGVRIGGGFGGGFFGGGFGGGGGSFGGGGASGGW